MNPEFYLILKPRDLSDELADAVYEAGFDDSSLIVRGGHAAIWIGDRPGELTKVVRHALAEAQMGGLEVKHVEIECAAFVHPK